MTLYTPEYFSGDKDVAVQLIKDYPFATLITGMEGQEPQISYLPLLLEENALWGHLAKANPHWRRFAQGRTYALFHGPHAYVSPDWYERPADNVPTWNYAVVHVQGPPEILNEAGARQVLKRLVARFDPNSAHPSPEKLERLLAGIVAFRLPLMRAETKFKMNQNKTEADRAGVIAGLRTTGRADEKAVADWMEQHGSR